MYYSASDGVTDLNQSYIYLYTHGGALQSVSIDTEASSGDEIYSYDKYGRMTTKIFEHYDTTVGKSFKHNAAYIYLTTDTTTTGNVSSYINYINGVRSTSFSYTYDDKNNITSIRYETGEEVRYVYDDLGQLIREDNPFNNYTCVYDYDNAGNITSVKYYSLVDKDATPSNLLRTVTYGYETSTAWGDLLTSYNGSLITYDNIGNPLTYFGSGMFYTFTWEGRKMMTAKIGNNTYSFTYNDNGYRTSKTVNGVTTRYYYDGSQLIAEETNGDFTVYIYDAGGSPIGMQCRKASYESGVWDIYWYEKNLQGDIVGIYYHDGLKMVTYTYDAWGNCTVSDDSNTSLASKNPFRYRGYYFDSDLELYRLGTRYYDASIRRFINADSYVSTGQGMIGNNMFAYCGNNPIVYVDHLGTSFNSFWEYFKEGYNEFIDWLNEYALNDDGSYSLYDNDRFEDYNAWHEQILAFTPSGPNFDLASGDCGLFGLSIDFYTGGWEWEHVDLSLFDFGHAEANLQIKDGTFQAGAAASAWSPSISFNAGNVSVSLGAEVIATGVSIAAGAGGFSAMFANGIGFSFAVTWSN